MARSRAGADSDSPPTGTCTRPPRSCSRN